MSRLLADGAGLLDASEPGVHTAAVIGTSKRKHPQLVPILLFVQANGTDIILVSLLKIMCRNLFQLLFGKSILLELFLVLDTRNCAPIKISSPTTPVKGMSNNRPRGSHCLGPEAPEPPNG